MTEHLSGYQARDFEVVDYHMSELPGTDLSFRGPFPDPDALASGNYFTCLGAAQTLGCFCEKPYPNLVADKIGLPVLNLGYGGAGPEFFERHAELDQFINGGRLVIVQIMSARSQSNSLFETRGLEYLVRRRDGVALGADEAYRDLIAGSPRIRAAIPGRLGRVAARRLSLPRVKEIVAETRSAWVENYVQFLGRIKVPKILLWISKRTPEYPERFGSVNSLFGEFPQMVTAEMVARVREHADDYVECVTHRGSPQPLFSRFNGKPVEVDPARDRPDLRSGKVWTHNGYYPSPEMQEDAATALLKTSELAAF